MFPLIKTSLDKHSRVEKRLSRDSLVFFAELNFGVEWHANAVSWLPGDIIFAQLVCPLNDVIFCLS